MLVYILLTRVYIPYSRGTIDSSDCRRRSVCCRCCRWSGPVHHKSEQHIMFFKNKQINKAYMGGCQKPFLLNPFIQNSHIPIFFWERPLLTFMPLTSIFSHLGSQIKKWTEYLLSFQNIFLWPRNMVWHPPLPLKVFSFAWRHCLGRIFCYMDSPWCLPLLSFLIRLPFPRHQFHLRQCPLSSLIVFDTSFLLWAGAGDGCVRVPAHGGCGEGGCRCRHSKKKKTWQPCPEQEEEKIFCRRSLW